MLTKLLVANRGEIACRIMATARRMGIATVAVYSDADAGALHVETADEAYRIGPAPAAESYLNINAIIEAARASGADAVHPGYGFLAENAKFAKAVIDAGLTFVGPPVAAMQAMGSKSAAKKIMERASVPLVPGYHGAKQNLATFKAAAKGIGYPVLLKAVAGGGGKGMRVVAGEGEMKEALGSAKREAKAAFGSNKMLVEKYLSHPRHIEVQVFADDHGNVVHLGERDCSIQRRHQKVVEEAPAAGLDADLAAEIADAAITATEAIGYVGAGTVEFLVDADGAFYFMEMNTRLQVEHAVTEMVTAEDLVAWQLSVASGAELPREQAEIAPSGHAIEGRLYGEDPDRDFIGQSGLLTRFRAPSLDDYGGAVRIDTGMREGDTITPHYDSLIAKIIVWGASRGAAVLLLRRVLAEIEVAGVTTNIGLLRRIAGHPEFAAGGVDTGFIARHAGELLPGPRPVGGQALALAALAVLLNRQAEAAAQARRSSDPHSPWHFTDGWRIGGDNHHDLLFIDGQQRISITAHFRDAGFELELPGGNLAAHGVLSGDGELIAWLGDMRIRASVLIDGDAVSVMADGGTTHLTLFDPAARAAGGPDISGNLMAPMPSKVVALLVKAGARVRMGQALIVVEAMKMEHALTAPADGRVQAIHCRVGEQVDEGAELLSFAADPG